MKVEFSKVITPSKIASLETFKCFIRDLDYFTSLNSNQNVEIQEYKEVIGKNFEDFVFKNYREADEIIDFSFFSADSLDDLKSNLKNYIEEGKTYLIHNKEGKGIPLKRENLDVDIEEKEYEEEEFKELINLLERKKSTAVFNDPYIYLDGLLVKKTDDTLYLKVVEIKSSKDIQRSHIFQSLWYCIGLENCFKESAVVENEVEIITRPSFNEYRINKIKFLSKIKSLMSFLIDIVQRIKNNSGIPPLSPVCEGCHKLQDCFNQSISKKSLFLFKSLKNEADYLSKKGYLSPDEVQKDIQNMEDTVLINNFLKEKEIIDIYGFHNDLNKLPESNKSKITLKIPESIIGFTLIPNPLYHVPLAISIFFYGEKLYIPSVFNNYEKNVLKNKNFASFVIYPSKESNIEKFEEFILNLILSIFELIQKDENPISVLYFDEQSKRTLSSFLFYHLKKNKEINSSLLSAYKAVSFSDTLEMEGYKETGFIVQNSLVLNKAFTNEPLNYKLSGLRSLGDKIDGEFKFNYVKFSDSPVLNNISINVSNEKILELQKKFYTPLSAVFSQEIKTLEVFDYEKGLFFYLKPEKEKDLVEYLSLINFETASIYNIRE